MHSQWFCTHPRFRCGVTIGFRQEIAEAPEKMSPASTWPDALREEKRFRHVIEQICDVLCLVDDAGRITYASPALRRVLGFEPEEFIGTDICDLLAAREREAAEKVLACAIEHPANPCWIENWVRHKDGTWRWVEASITNLLDDGEVGALAVSFRDVTRRKRTEEAMRRREEEFRTFFEMAGVGTAEIDPSSGRFLRVNQKLCSLVDYTPDELLTITPSALAHPEDALRDWELWQSCLNEGGSEYTDEKRYVRKDGSPVWVQVTTSVIRDEHGRPLRGAVIVRDVTDRRHAIESLQRTRTELERRVKVRTTELAAANQRLETLIAASPLSIISLGPDLIVRRWNPASEQLFGWKETEVLGKPLPILPSADRDRYESEVRRLLTDPTLRHLEMLTQHREGDLLDVSIWRAPLYDENNTLIGSMAIIMNVTESKRLERALLDAGEREQRRIGQDLHDQLCQQLLGVACVLKALAINAEKNSNLRPEDLHNAARLVNDSVQQTRDIARGLHPVELDAEGLMSALRELAERINATVPCELHCHRPVLVNDPDAAMHYYRIAQEAVTNAVRHAEPTQILIRLTEDPEHILLEILDNGRGLESASTRGGGMGLDIMKYRAHAIGGRLLLETQPSGGTRVACSIPKPK
jgi:PAS domain S-box-containing protein